MRMSAIVLLVLFAGFGNIIVHVRCGQNFVLTELLSYFAEVFLATTGLLPPRRVTIASTRRSPTSLTPPPP
jgi:hypothetical protein